MGSEKLWTPSESTDYSFENGLRIAEIYPDLRQGNTIQIATPEDIRRLSKDPYSPEHMNKIVEQVKNPRYIRGLGGVGIEVARRFRQAESWCVWVGRQFSPSKRVKRSYYYDI